MSVRRTCTLLAGLAIERGTRDDWRRLAPLHYRSHHAGAITDVFRLVHRPAKCPLQGESAASPSGQPRMAVQGARADQPPVAPGDGTCPPKPTSRRVDSPSLPRKAHSPRPTLVGVIVYSHSPLSLAARNRATAGRYRIGPAAGRLVNRELRIISRVVIVPNWRGLGLASRLVAETMPQIGTPYVEALAAMGRMHPFFEQAGMTVYPPPVSAAGGERLRAAFEAAGLARSDRRSADALETAIDALAAADRQLVEREIRRWARSYLAAKNHRTNQPDRQRMFELVARQLDAAPVYYLWRRGDAGSDARARRAAPNRMEEMKR